MDGTDRNGSAVPASATRTGISVKLPAIAASMPSARLMWRKAFWPLQLGAVVFPPDGHAMNSVPFGWKNPSQFAPFLIPGAGPEAPVRTQHTADQHADQHGISSTAAYTTPSCAAVACW